METTNRRPGAPPAAARSRQATAGDIPGLYRIVAAARENRQFETPDGFAEAVRPFIAAGLCRVLTLAGAIAGFVAVDARAGSVEMLYVDPAFEGRTVGRALMRRALDDLVRLGHRTASLVTARDTRAERFYRAQGWTEMGPAGRGSIRMKKALSGL